MYCKARVLKTGLPGKVIGVSTYGPLRPISIWMDDSALPADDTAALNIAAAHEERIDGLEGHS